MSEQGGSDPTAESEGVHGSEPGDDSPERQEADLEGWTEKTETGGEAAS